MEIFDNEKARRVWQRVQGEIPRKTEEAQLRSYILREWEDSRVYGILGEKLSGRDKAVMGRLRRQEQEHAATLMGICRLCNEEPPVYAVQKPENGPVALLLRRCYGRKMQAVEEYEKWSDTSPNGRVFKTLAQQELQQSLILLELLGRYSENGRGAAPRRR